AGNRGDNLLKGGAGSDVYVHELYGGDDRIVEASGSNDTLLFGAGITTKMASLRRRGGDLVVDLAGPHGSVTIEDWFKSSSRRVESIRFADGTVWSEDTIRLRTGTDCAYDGGQGGSHHGGYVKGDRDHDERPQDRDGNGKGKEKNGHEKKGDGHGGHDDRDAVADFIAGWLSSAPRFDFARLDELTEPGGKERAMSAEEIARGWQAAAAYAQSLDHESDEEDGFLDGRHMRGWMLGGEGWGYEGSTGERRGPDGLQHFCGLQEGFRRL